MKVSREFDLMHTVTWLVILVGLGAFWWCIVRLCIDVYHRWVLFEPPW